MSNIPPYFDWNDDFPHWNLSLSLSLSISNFFNKILYLYIYIYIYIWYWYPVRVPNFLVKWKIPPMRFWENREMTKMGSKTSKNAPRNVRLLKIDLWKSWLLTIFAKLTFTKVDFWRFLQNCWLLTIFTKLAYAKVDSWHYSKIDLCKSWLWTILTKLTCEKVDFREYPDFRNRKVRIRVMVFLVKSMKKVPFLWVLTTTRISRIRKSGSG